MHGVLVRPSSDPAFAPIIAGAEEVAELAERVRIQLGAAYRAVDNITQSDAVADQDKGSRDRLLGRLPALSRMLDGATLTRIHGDLHLGQVLVCNGDVMLIDFEGEPAKPIEARRGKDHPMRDVAGVIRSFDYAAAMVQRRSQASHAHLTDAQVAGFVDSFVERATDAFLTGYQEASADPSHQAQAAADLELLNLFLIEKAAYEVVYEAANRPTWIDVPLRGLARRTRNLLGAEADA
jgi:maltose alpha-D-glucosyltransferase/alpha-amylase